MKTLRIPRPLPCSICGSIILKRHGTVALDKDGRPTNLLSKRTATAHYDCVYPSPRKQEA